MSKKFDLSGKTAMTTGAGSGIGKAIAISLAENGAYSIVLDIDKEAAEKTLNEIISAGGKGSAFHCDVTRLELVKKVFDQALKDKTLDILVNNAGVAHVGDILNTSEADFDRVYQVNIKGVFHTLQTGVNHMKDTGGSVINISSVSAMVGVGERFAYSSSKGAVHAMTLSVAKDFVSKNIRCNSIAPARVHTPFVDGFIAKNYPGKEQEMFEKLSKTQPIGRMGKPQEIGDLVLYLASDEASFITGSNFVIDGGFVTLNT